MKFLIAGIILLGLFVCALAMAPKPARAGLTGGVGQRQFVPGDAGRHERRVRIADDRERQLVAAL